MSKKAILNDLKHAAIAAAAADDPLTPQAMSMDYTNTDDPDAWWQTFTGGSAHTVVLLP